jgi:Phosphotransferase enzyme family
VGSSWDAGGSSESRGYLCTSEPSGDARPCEDSRVVVANEELARRGLSAAIAVAEREGLRLGEPTILRDRGNLLVHLTPAPVVARVATLTGTRRAGDDWLRREVSVAGFLASAGAPVVAPSAELDPGPHTHDGISLSFWEYVEEVATPLDAAEAGRRLWACHEVLAGYEGELEPLGTLTEAERWLEELVVEERLGAQEAAGLRRDAESVRRRIDALRLPMQAVHGDAHLDNAINTAAGPLWNDWEDTCLAPRALDLGCLEAAASVWGDDPEPVARALAAYGEIDADALAVFVAARRFQGTMWSVLLDSA